MSDFQFVVDADFSSILSGFQQIEDRAAKTGRKIAEELGKNVGNRSFAALYHELERLEKKQFNVNIDESIFDRLEVRIKSIKSLLDTALQRKRVIGIDDQTIDGLRAKLKYLQNQQTKVKIDSEDLLAAERLIRSLNKELQLVENRKITVDADANSVLAITTQLNQRLNDIKDRRIRLNIDVDKEEIEQLGREALETEKQITKLNRLLVDIDVDPGSLQALRARLKDLEDERIKLGVDSGRLKEVVREIDRTQDRIADLERNLVTINVDPNSFTAVISNLEAQLRDLEKIQTSIDMDGSEVVQVTKWIAELQKELQSVRNRKITIDADANSILAITTRLKQELQDIKNRQIRLDIDVDREEIDQLGRKAIEIEKQINKLDQMIVDIDVDSNSLMALQKRLQDLENERIRIDVDNSRFDEILKEASEIEDKIDSIKRKKITINVDPNSFAAVGASLEAELQRLEKKLVSINMDSREVQETTAQIRSVRDQLKDLEQRKASISIDVNDSSLNALQAKLRSLESQRADIDVNINPEGFREFTRQINETRRELETLDNKTITIDADANSILAITTRLKQELKDIEYQMVRVDIEVKADELSAARQRAQELRNEIDRLDQLTVDIDVNTGTISALRDEINKLESNMVNLKVDSEEFKAAAQEAEALERKMANLSRLKVTITADDNSFVSQLSSLEARLESLRNKQVRIDFDSAEVAKLQVEIDGLENQVNSLKQKKLLITADPSSIIALKSKLDDLQRKIESVGTGSSTFRNLQSEIRKTQVELDRATSSGSTLKQTFRSLTSAIVEISIIAGSTVLLGKALTDSAISAETMQKRMAGLADQYGETAQVQQAIEDSAKKLNLTTTETGEGFLQLYGVLRTSGVALNDVKAIYTGTTAAAKNFGLSTEEVKGAIVQLRQALAGDFKTAGQELNSILEQLPPVAKAIADELGIATGDIKEFAKSGKISSEIVISAIQKLNSAELARLATTMDSAKERLKKFGVEWNKLSITIGQVALSIGLPIVNALTKVISVINGLVTSFQNAPGIIKAFIGAAVGIPAVLAVAAVAITGFQLALSSLSVQLVIANFQGLATAISGVATLLTVQLAGAATVAAVGFSQLGNAITTGAALSALAGALQTVTMGLGAFAAASWAAVAPYAPLLLIIGLVVGAIAAYKAAFGGADKITESLADSQEKSRASANRLNHALGETTKTAEGQGNAIQRFFGAISTGLELTRAQQEVDKLTERFQKVSGKAQEFLTQLSNGKPVTGEFKADVIAVITALDSQEEALRSSADALRRRANELDGMGRSDAAQKLREEAAELDRHADSAKASANALREKSGVQKTDIKTTEDATQKEKDIEQAIKKRAEAEAELNKIIAEAPVRAADNQIKIGTELLNLSKALTAQEQSRFDITKSALDYQLKKAEERGASEQEIKNIKDRMNQVDIEAAKAKYQALIQEQAIQRQLLALTQQKARAEADSAFKEQQVKVLEAQVQLSKAASAEERAAAEANLRLQQEILGIKGEQVNVVRQIEPIQNAVMKAEQQTAINTEQARLAQLGYKVAADGTLQAVSAITGASSQIGIVTSKNAEAQELVRRYAADTGTEIREAANGALVLGDNAGEVARVTGDINAGFAGARNAANEAATATGGIGQGATSAANQIGQIGSRFTTASNAAISAANSTAEIGNKAGGVSSEISGVASSFNGVKAAANQTATEAGKIGTAVGDASGKADGVKGSLDGAKTAVIKVAQEAGKLANAVDGAKNPSSDIASAFVSTGKNAPAAAQGARDFAAYLSKAKGFAKEISGINIASQMATVASRTREAAVQAENFYQALRRAAQLPGARWAGGPVEAGQTYRINEIGREALLSGGKLRMINAPANSLWRAPSSGVVIPAGVTSRLQEQGVISGGKAGGSNTAVFAGARGSGNAELAIEIGKLRAEVAELTRKDWNVNITTKTGPSGSQVMRSLLR